MRTILAVTRETFLRLRRDKIFVPATIVGISLLILSGLASYWGVEEFFKILYDLGSATYHLTGAIVAIFWGNKLIADSRQEGSLEVQLASPISRSSWLLGKFIGLSLALTTMAFLFLVGWQLVYLLYNMGIIPIKDLILFGLLTLSWIVIGAVSIFFATILSSAVALFCSIWMFVAGLLSGPIAQAMSPETPVDIRTFIEVLAGLWNLHYFNIGTQVSDVGLPNSMAIISRLLYGISLVGFFISGGCLLFQRRDIVN